MCSEDRAGVFPDALRVGDERRGDRAQMTLIPRL